MNIAELHSKNISELHHIACNLQIDGYSELRKQELIFKILEVQSQGMGAKSFFGQGVLEVVPEGFGFFRRKIPLEDGRTKIDTSRHRRR